MFLSYTHIPICSWIDPPFSGTLGTRRRRQIDFPLPGEPRCAQARRLGRRETAGTGLSRPGAPGAPAGAPAGAQKPGACYSASGLRDRRGISVPVSLRKQKVPQDSLISEAQTGVDCLNPDLYPKQRRPAASTTALSVQARKPESKTAGALRPHPVIGHRCFPLPSSLAECPPSEPEPSEGRDRRSVNSQERPGTRDCTRPNPASSPPLCPPSLNQVLTCMSVTLSALARAVSGRGQVLLAVEAPSSSQICRRVKDGAASSSWGRPILIGVTYTACCYSEG